MVEKQLRHIRIRNRVLNLLLLLPKRMEIEMETAVRGIASKEPPRKRYVQLFLLCKHGVIEL